MLVTILAVFAGWLVLERIVPGCKLPHVRTWPVRVLAINAAQLGVVVLAGVMWEKSLAGGSLFDLSALPNALGGFITSFYKHPVEMIANSIIGSVLVYAVLGLSLEAGAVYTLCCALGEFFYHTNCRTPRWVGYVFQRPEMHRIHHEYGAHRCNYGDIVWWDMLFGTWRNPATWEGRCGFDAPREERLVDMLRFRDVHDDPRR